MKTYTYTEGLKIIWDSLGQTQTIPAFLGWVTSGIIFGLIGRIIDAILFGF